MALPGMDRPPLPSPDIQAQMGVPQGPPSPGAGLSAIAQRNTAAGPQGQAGAPGAPNPHGFLLAQVDAIKAVLDKIANAEPTFAPFAQKAVQILDTGVSAVSTAPTSAPGAGPSEAGGAGAAPVPPGTGGGVPPLG